jgi:ribosomal protein S9
MQKVSEDCTVRSWYMFKEFLDSYAPIDQQMVAVAVAVAGAGAGARAGAGAVAVAVAVVVVRMICRAIMLRHEEELHNLCS